MLNFQKCSKWVEELLQSSDGLKISVKADISSTTAQTTKKSVMDVTDFPSRLNVLRKNL
jgi:hypothetical protein